MRLGLAVLVRGVLVTLLAALTSWLSIATPAPGSLPEGPTGAICTYCAPAIAVAPAGYESERGPPETYGRTTTGAVDRWSHGASARPEGPSPTATNGYTALTHPALATRPTPTTQERVRCHDGTLPSLGRSDVAANAAEDVGSATNKIFSNRVLQRAAEESGPYHNFPTSFDDEIFSNGTKTTVSNFFNKAKPNLSNDSIQYRLPGYLNGRSGTYEIFTRPSLSGRTEMIMHRFFRPDY